MTPTDQTPDAVRAAIAEDTPETRYDAAKAVQKYINMMAMLRTEPTLEGVMDALESHGYTVGLAQIGALRPVGEGVNTEPTAKRDWVFDTVRIALEAVLKREWAEEAALRVVQELRALDLILPDPDAAARAGDGAT